MVKKGMINQKTVQYEIEYITSFLKRFKRKWERDTFILVNKNTIEDNAIIEIFKHNSDLGELKTVDTVVNNVDSIISNTDNYLLTAVHSNQLKTNYTLNVFADYSEDDLKEILKYYDVDFSNFEKTNYEIEEAVIELYKKYIANELEIAKVKFDLRKKFLNFLKERNKKTNISIMNSYTANIIY